MFNLLPEPEKKQILSEYNTRRLIVMLLFILAIGIIAIISIFPTYIESIGKVTDVQSNLSTINNSPIFAEETALTAGLSQANQKLVALQPPKGEAYLENIITAVLKHKTLSVRLDGFSFTRNNSGSVLVVSGVARNRDTLSAFVDSMQVG